jgi:anti-anti-sigma regulatory factor
MPAEIDVANADEIQRALVSAASLGAPVLIVDMSGTTFCDSAGGASHHRRSQAGRSR